MNDNHDFERIRTVLGKFNGLIWELNNTPMSHSVTTWYDEIIKAGKELQKIGGMYKESYDKSESQLIEQRADKFIRRRER